jgi:ATP-binding protein involved in chromosome partitioning
VATSLTAMLGTDVPLLGQIPLDPRMGAAGDAGTPIVVSAPDSPLAATFREVAAALADRLRDPAGRPLPVGSTGI